MFSIVVFLAKIQNPAAKRKDFLKINKLKINQLKGIFIG